MPRPPHDLKFKANCDVYRKSFKRGDAVPFTHPHILGDLHRRQLIDCPAHLYKPALNQKGERKEDPTPTAPAPESPKAPLDPPKEMDPERAAKLDALASVDLEDYRALKVALGEIEGVKAKGDHEALKTLALELLDGASK